MTSMYVMASGCSTPHTIGAAQLAAPRPHARVRLRRPLAMVVVSIALTMSACSSETAAPIVGEATTSTAAPAIEPTIEVTYFAVDPQFDVMRFVAEIKNNASEPLVGLRTEWIAYDANDVIVGNRTKQQPAIPAGGTFDYVGGAGSANLTGTPARVEVTVVDPGSRDADAASSLLEVTDVVANPNTVLGGFDDATATVTAPADGVRKDDLASSMIIRNAEGIITDADFIGDIVGPDVFPSGSKFAVRFSLYDYEGPVDQLEIQVYIDQGD